MSDTDPFLEKMRPYFQTGNYMELLAEWGKEMSNSDPFKQAAFAGFQPSANDVIISTYPKSGTTWALQIAYQISYLGEGDYDHSYQVFPWPDKLIPIDDNPELTDLSYMADSPTGLHIIKSHLETSFIPYTAEGKYISIIRDPKDMLVSMIHFENGFNRLLFDATVPIEAFVDSFQTDHFMYQPWPMFIDSWWSWRERENVLILTFEEMKADHRGSAQKMADFLGVSLTGEQFEKVIEKSSYAYMKANDHKYSQPAWDEAEHVPLVRSGNRGDSKAMFTAEQRAAVDAHCLKALARLGSTFPYRELYM